ncbi:ubiquitin-conjugating enzyme/RWD-like protein, partial [Podospora appendiculata]
KASTLEISKQILSQLVDGIMVNNYSTHLGLVTFHVAAKVSHPLTYMVEHVKDTDQKLESHGDTVLWDALALARDKIQEYSTWHPGVKKRIICISGGTDTKSKHNRARYIAKLLADSDIVVDSFCLGEEKSEFLGAISHLTDGYTFRPTSLDQAMAIFDMEPVLSQTEGNLDAIADSRQAQKRLKSGNFDSSRFDAALSQARPEDVTQDVFSNRKEHPHLLDRFADPKSIAAQTSKHLHQGNITNRFTPAYIRNRRILDEINEIANKPHPHMDVYISEQHASFWKVIFRGPPESAYSDGTFVMYLDMDDTYPAFAPTARFITPIYHRNVNHHGRVCHPAFHREWTADTSNFKVLSNVYELLLASDYRDRV